MSDNTIKLIPGRPNRGMFPITLMRGDEVLLAAELNPHKSDQVRRLLKRVAKEFPGLNGQAEDLRRELLQLARPQASASSPVQEEREMSIVRPEFFIRPDVIGLTVAEPIIADGRPAGRWKLHLRWSDGRREVRDLADFIELPGGARLWLHPIPSNPSPSLVSGWSMPARRAWAQGAQGAELAPLFRRLCDAISSFVDFPEAEAAGVTATLALWVMLTYIFPAWDAVPYLYVGGPLGSGKSRVFEILARLVFRPLTSSNMTSAALFRTLNDRGGSLVMDEAERLRENSPDAAELRSILLAGYKRGGKATRLEAVGETFRTIEFDCYGPKALACIGGLTPALASRCIQINMFRAGPGSEKPKRRIDADPQLWSGLRDDLHSLALGSLGLVALDLAGRSDVCALAGRSYELWQPLMSLAAAIQDAGLPGLLELVQRHAARVTESSRDDETPDIDELLLRLLAGALQEQARPSAPSPAEILAKAQQAEPEMFRRWTARAVSVHLKRYGITVVKAGGQRLYRDVTIPDLRRVQRHYSMDLGLDDIPDTHPGFAPFAPLATHAPAPEPQEPPSLGAQVAQVAQKSGGCGAANATERRERGEL